MVVSAEDAKVEAAEEEGSNGTFMSLRLIDEPWARKLDAELAGELPLPR